MPPRWVTLRSPILRLLATANTAATDSLHIGGVSYLIQALLPISMLYPDSPETRKNPLPTAADGILLAK